MSRLRRIPAWCWLWALASLPALALRPAWPIDETRYLAVGWAATHPDGVIVTEPDERDVPHDAAPIAVFPSGFTLWDAAALLSRPTHP